MIVMATQLPSSGEDYPHLLEQIRLVREEREESLKKAREISRDTCVQAVVIGGISVAKAAELSGHSRQSITLWLQIHNAEQKGRADRK